MIQTSAEQETMPLELQLAQALHWDERSGTHEELQKKNEVGTKILADLNHKLDLNNRQLYHIDRLKRAYIAQKKRTLGQIHIVKDRLRMLRRQAKERNLPSPDIKGRDTNG